jgi:glutathione S-transferase
MRIYYRPGTGRPLRVAWALEEIGSPYEPIRVTAEAAREPEHLARHPLGRVPVLEQDGQTVFESTSLCLHVADQHPETDLLPVVGDLRRALAYQWSIFAMTELEVPTLEYLRHRESDPEWAAAGKQRFDLGAAVIDHTLDGREFLIGDSLTVADIVTAGVLALADYAGLIEDVPNISAYLARMRARPAFQRAAQATESLHSG